MDFSGGSAVKNSPAMQETQETGVLSLGGEEPQEGHGNLLQCSCPENFMDRKAWWATVQGVGKKPLSTHAYPHTHTRTHIQLAYVYIVTGFLEILCFRTLYSLPRHHLEHDHHSVHNPQMNESISYVEEMTSWGRSSKWDNVVRSR